MIRKLNFWYYGAFAAAVLAATLGYFCLSRGWFVIARQTQANVAVYATLILYVLATTPLVLKFFGRFVARIRLVPDEGERQRRYARLVVARLAVVTLGLAASLFFYYVLQENSLLWLAGISAIALYFCKPTRAKVEQDLSPDDDTQPAEPSDHQP